jgi:hypothetical protein
VLLVLRVCETRGELGEIEAKFAPSSGAEATEAVAPLIKAFGRL